MPDIPLRIPCQDSLLTSWRATEISSSASTAMRIPTEANIEPSGEILPMTPRTMPSSPRTAPMPDMPLSTPCHESLLTSCKALAISSRACAAIRIPAELEIAPLTLSLPMMPSMIDISARAPPMPARP